MANMYTSNKKQVSVQEVPQINQSTFQVVKNQPDVSHDSLSTSWRKRIFEATTTKDLESKPKIPW